MCGIAGILSFNQEPVSLQKLRKMTDVISHRGPDGEGQWVNTLSTVGLAHRRLSIIDLSDEARQPMHYLNRYSITFNGEIYNYIELKEELVKKGYSFASSSDTEVLLALFDHKREKCLDDLDGMFAFAIWDEQEQTLFCARDRFGEKPLYYFRSPSGFFFASEMKALWAVGIPKQTNNRMLFYYINHDFVLNPFDSSETFYQDIVQLKEAHYCIVKPDGSFRMTEYWNLSEISQSRNLDFDDACDHFKELLTQSVKRRLRSDVPVGSSLSGGLDSSTIVMLIDKYRLREQDQNTFSARFKNFAKDEGRYMEEVIASCRVKPYFTWPDENSAVADIEKVFYHQEEPFGSASILAQWEVMKLARRNNVTVLLDGQGADETLAGYVFYYPVYLNQLYKTDKELFKTEYAVYQDFHGKSYPYDIPVWLDEPEYIQAPVKRKETARMKLGRWRRKIMGIPLYSYNESIFNKDFFESLKNVTLPPIPSSSLTESLRFSSGSYGLNTLLRYADRNSMAHSREIRLPFLNHQLVEFIFTLPDDFKLKEGWTKYILRKSMSDILPPSVTWRKDKVGYEPPQNNWLQSGKMTEMAKEGQKKLIDLHIVNPQSVEQVDQWKSIMVSFLLK